MSRCMMMYIWSSDARNKNCFVWGWNKFHRIDCLEILEGLQKWVWFWSRNDPRGELKIGQSEEAASLVHQGKRNWEAMPGHADFRNTLPELCCASQEVVVATSALEGTRAPFPTRKTTHLSGRERKVLPSFSSSVSADQHGGHEAAPATEHWKCVYSKRRCDLSWQNQIPKS